MPKTNVKKPVQKLRKQKTEKRHKAEKRAKTLFAANRTLVPV
jgi:hypothetical protein